LLPHPHTIMSRTAVSNPRKRKQESPRLTQTTLPFVNTSNKKQKTTTKTTTTHTKPEEKEQEGKTPESGGSVAQGPDLQPKADGEVQVVKLEDDSLVTFYPRFQSKEEAQELFEQLLHAIPWQQSDITVYGKTYKSPRMQCWMANGAGEQLFSFVVACGVC